jgi:biopolymer transport protein ExbD
LHIETTRFTRRRLTLTPLIDVIFLLLLFFMLSSTFSRFSQVPVAAPATGMAAAPGKAGALLVVRADSYTLNGEVKELSSLAAALEEVMVKGAARLMIIVDETASAQNFVGALEAAEAAGMPVSVSGKRQ